MQCHVSWWNLLQFLLFSVNLAINREHACIWFKIPEAHEPMMDVKMDSRACNKIIWEVQEAIYVFVPALRLILKKQWIYKTYHSFSSRMIHLDRSWLFGPVAQEVDRERLSTTIVVAGFTGTEIHPREWLLRVKILFFFKLTNKNKSIAMNWTI